jgi:hypothetical protein
MNNKTPTRAIKTHMHIVEPVVDLRELALVRNILINFDFPGEIIFKEVVSRRWG